MKELTARERMLLGVLGAAIVAIATYPVSEKGYADLIIKRDYFEWLGFALRLAGMSALGAVWGFIHRPESDPKRALQLGMVAPAAIAGMIYANLDSTTATGKTDPNEKVTELLIQESPIALVGTAHAANWITDIPISIPPITSGPGIMERIVKGFFGK